MRPLMQCSRAETREILFDIRLNIGSGCQSSDVHVEIEPPIGGAPEWGKSAYSDVHSLCHARKVQGHLQQSSSAKAEQVVRPEKYYLLLMCDSSCDTDSKSASICRRLLDNGPYDTL